MMADGNYFFVAGAKVFLLITLHLKIDDFIFSLSSLKNKNKKLPSFILPTMVYFPIPIP